MVTQARTRANHAWYALSEQVPQDTKGECYCDNMPLDRGRIVAMVLFYGPTAEFLEFGSAEQYRAWLKERGYTNG